MPKNIAEMMPYKMAVFFLRQAQKEGEEVQTRIQDALDCLEYLIELGEPH